ncbi:DUF695 domain-containing protein [Sphingobacterium sp. DK4209]|uniref:DUF695 domain-containing protein n=1 Tax=Sphingobacterium zhuxiongii TaxID=2662364 RepID=A0A5Q0QF25_9SPHI|nr:MULTISPECIES: DUF695 domain-containing protein [unclassified Sphingobacterium]MVZ64452.1 DUF695 domain-containing protein [Sphingobacterium sp. DK4209]QGA25790.1 DUF695 domain-containing protein [Sphingobacterium sp. dk4302]
MSIFNKLFKGNSERVSEIQSIVDFWKWFNDHEKEFYKAVQDGKNIEGQFFVPLAEQLSKLHERIYFLVGIHKETKVAELTLTPDAIVRNIAFIEDLVKEAPSLDSWRFIALKEASDIKDFGIKMNNRNYSSDNLKFYPIEHPAFPDQIDLVLVYELYDANLHEEIYNGVCIFLDNALGELKSITSIDNVSVVGPDQEHPDLIPLEKLNAYLTWREKEFVEKYDKITHNSQDDVYSSFEGELEDGLPIFAIVNKTLLDWDYKASHPWVLLIMIHYDGIPENGLPDDATYELMDRLEDDVSNRLPETEGYLNILRETGNGLREINMVCRDFRTPSRVMTEIVKKYANNFKVEFDIYKDKYWHSFDKFKE